MPRAGNLLPPPGERLRTDTLVRWCSAGVRPMRGVVDRTISEGTAAMSTRNEAQAALLDPARRQFLATLSAGLAAAGAVSLLPQRRARAETAAAAGDAIRPFQVHFPDEDLAELRLRLKKTRWPDKETVNDQSQGIQREKLQPLVAYWATQHDWRKAEAKLNALPQFITEIDGLDIHFIHVRSQHPNALPLIITHGWPGSVIEQLKLIGPLTDPTAHGGSAADAFDVVIPSLPGYGFSGKTTAP